MNYRSTPLGRVCKFTGRIMKKDPSSELIEESIRLEKNVAALYQLYAELFPEDADFWRQLQLEEESHARLLRDAKDAFIGRGKFPAELMAGTVEELRQANTTVLALTEQFRSAPPSRKEACEAAILIENESGESHYTRFMDKDPESAAETVFQQLNKQDKDHERRIKEKLASMQGDS